MNLLFARVATMMLEDNNQFAWVDDVVAAIRSVLWPLLIVVAAAGSIYAVVLGVKKTDCMGLRNDYQEWKTH